MKAKFVHESLEDVLRPKSKDDKIMNKIYKAFLGW